MSGHRAVRVIVRGRVQGVGFRAFVEDEANARRLKGWVRNRRDGTVETVAAGAAGEVEAFLETLRRGPPAARVDALDVRDDDEAAHHSSTDGFTVLPTV